jgi:hypothetical protein
LYRQEGKVVLKARLWVLGATLCLAWLVASAAASGQDYVWGESEAWPSSDAGFQGYWKYRVSISWNVAGYSDPGRALSHVSIILGLDNCLDVCSDDYFAFPDTVGSSEGEGLCTVYYYLEFDCTGDPTVPERSPTIKFEPYPSECEPDIAGTATVCFYSIAPPDTASTGPAHVWVKFGPDVERGLIEGPLPRCDDISTGAETSAWGAIKLLFR